MSDNDESKLTQSALAFRDYISGLRPDALTHADRAALSLLLGELVSLVRRAGTPSVRES